ncbi:MAG: hypothetical protein QXY29_02135, partial [Candidatus Aenigmatarchaeota archaeon]
AGWISVGLMVAGGILMISGIGAPLGAYLLAAGFGMGVASSVADISVGLARKSAGINDMDDNLRLIFAPLGFIPVGKTAGQVGKQVGKRVGKEFMKRELEDMSKYATWLFRRFGGTGNISVVSKTFKSNKIIASTSGFDKTINVNPFHKDFIIKNMKNIIRHETIHNLFPLVKFQKKYFPNAAKTGELNKIINEIVLNKKYMKEGEILNDLFCSLNFKDYGKYRVFNFLKNFGEKVKYIKTSSLLKLLDEEKYLKNIHVVIKNKRISGKETYNVLKNMKENFPNLFKDVKNLIKPKIKDIVEKEKIILKVILPISIINNLNNNSKRRI